MRVLFTLAAAEAHLYPLVPLGWAFRAAGHSVLMATSADFVPAVTATGLPAAAVADEVDLVGWLRPPGPPPGSPSGPPPGSPSGPPPGSPSGADRAGPPSPGEMAARTGRRFGELAVRALAGTRALVERWRPDLVIAEPAEFAGPSAAAAAGRPWVRHQWGLPLRPELAANAVEALAAGGGGWAEPARTLDVCPGSVQYPGVDGGLRMRYVPFNGTAVVEPWLLEPPARPRVLLTLGTILPRDERAEPLWRRLLEQLSGLGAQVCIAVPDRHRASLGPLPDGVRAGRLPLAQALAGCSMIVHHGGSGTAMTAMAAGVPQVILPHFADQFGNAERFSAVGAARSLPPHEASDAELREACEAVLTDPAHRRAAKSVAAENAAAPDPHEIAGRFPSNLQ
ncbi:nucleotide disphospho-sugar-binding domain-containing protein [Dactylosporangium sp. NPDC000244]|uniref:nucleotide disphospho-sugar-binding domain-containing protein n=1 Tax=Dactylosporangium sp. NPDC000244 TaxID=3154365 RepID=UPI00331C37C1